MTDNQKTGFASPFNSQKAPSDTHKGLIDPRMLLADLDEMYLLAQLLVNRSEDVNALVERAVDLRFRGSTLSAADLLRASLTANQYQGQSDLIKERQIESDLAHIIPRLIAKTTPNRRIEIVQAFIGNHPDAVERSSFMHRVRRALELHADASSSGLVTETQVSRSIQNYVNSTLTPVSPGLRGSLESRYSPHSAPDQHQNRSRNSTPKRSVPVRIAAGFLLIIVASAIGTWIAKPGRLPEVPEDRNEILSQIDGYTTESGLIFQGSDRGQIERLIEERTGQRVALPSLTGGSIIGLSIESITPNFSIPAVRYSIDNESIRVFTLDYRTIQQVSQLLDFDASVLNQISTSQGLDIHVLDSKSRIVFRNRDDIFITFASENPQDFRQLFRFDR